MQYDMFEHEIFSHLRQEVNNLDLKYGNLRRGIFARHDELKRAIEELRAELNEVKQIQAKKKAELVPFFGELVEISK